MNHLRATSMVLIALAISAPASALAQNRAETTQKTILAHYMSWYASKPVSGEWGWHWTMNRFNPDNTNSRGQREVASHDYPLIGPYDSSDIHALECHALLTKFAGLDGLIIDWYGTADFRDYPMIHRNAIRLISYLKKAGLQYAVCYEDQSVKHRVENGHLPRTEDLAAAASDMKWLGENCFNDPSYLTQNDQPVLLVFGPQYFSKDQWHTIVAGTPKRPLLFGLPHLAQGRGMDAAFGWPPVTGGREITPEVWRAYLRKLHSLESSISVVFPGFRDIYNEAGLHESYGFIDDRAGKTFDETLAAALSSPSQIIQVATWNDYGEGTVIEPTANNGYRYLEALQKSRGSSAQLTPDDLRLPVLLYQLRKQYANDSSKQLTLQKAADHLFAGQCKEARKALEATQESSIQGNQSETPR